MASQCTRKDTGKTKIILSFYTGNMISDVHYSAVRTGVLIEFMRLLTNKEACEAAERLATAIPRIVLKFVKDGREIEDTTFIAFTYLVLYKLMKGIVETVEKILGCGDAVTKIAQMIAVGETIAAGAEGVRDAITYITKRVEAKTTSELTKDKIKKEDKSTSILYI